MSDGANYWHSECVRIQAELAEARKLALWLAASLCEFGDHQPNCEEQPCDCEWESVYAAANKHRVAAVAAAEKARKP